MSGYSYYETVPSYGEEAMVAGLLIFLVLFYVLMIGVAIASYVLNALAFQKIAQRRQIRNPFLAWIPVANNWLIGSIADDYDARSGINKNWKKILLFVSFIPIALVVLLYIVVFAAAFSMSISGNSDGMDMFMAFFPTLIIMPLMMFTTLQTVLNGICLYKVFESTAPEKSVKYLILYLLIPVVGSWCLFKCRNMGYSNIVSTPEPYSNQSNGDNM